MFDFQPNKNLEPSELYRELIEAADALTRGEPDPVANMANVAALIWEFIPDLNWAGFYRVAPAIKGGEELVLGPFMGRPACIRIPLGQGVCGTAAQRGETQLVDDVHSFPGHIACDAASRSEVVVPVLHKRQLLAVIDLDSPKQARFSADDAKGLQGLAKVISNRI